MCENVTVVLCIISVRAEGGFIYLSKQFMLSDLFIYLFLFIYFLCIFTFRVKGK